MTMHPAFFGFLLLVIGGCSGDSSSPGQVEQTNNPPSISSISGQSVTANSTTGEIAFSVDDDRTPPDDLTVTGASDNLALVGDDGIVIRGSGTQRSVELTPIGGQTGTATISVSVSDNQGERVQQVFLLTVTPQLATFDTFLRETFAAPESDNPQSINDKEFNNDEASDFDDLLTL